MYMYARQFHIKISFDVSTKFSATTLHLNIQSGRKVFLFLKWLFSISERIRHDCEASLWRRR